MIDLLTHEIPVWWLLVWLLIAPALSVAYQRPSAAIVAWIERRIRR